MDQSMQSVRQKFVSILPTIYRLLDEKAYSNDFLNNNMMNAVSSCNNSVDAVHLDFVMDMIENFL